MDSAAVDADAVGGLARLPRVVVDDLGLAEEGLPGIVRLDAEGGHVRATGFGPLDLDVRAALAAIHEAPPAALCFGTDLPGTRAPRRVRSADIAVVRKVLGDEGARSVQRDNAVARDRPRVWPPGARA